MKKNYFKLISVMMVVVFNFTVLPVLAAEKESAKIKLPDGVYLYDSWIEKLGNGDISIRYEKFFFVKNNIIYSSKDALKKFGTVKLNEPFLKEKKHKILLGGEKIGEIYNLRIDDDGHKKYEEKLFTKAIKEGSAYGKGSIKIQGSAAKCLAAPEEYKEVKKKVYAMIPQEEVDKVAKLAREKLYPMVEYMTKIYKWSLYEESLKRLDKISVHNGELYIGSYNFAFKKAVDARQWSHSSIEMIFSAKNNNVHFITREQDETFMTICGMLDVDGDGDGELLIERTSIGEDADDPVSEIIMEIYKQKADSNWTLIYKK